MKWPLKRGTGWDRESLTLDTLIGYYMKAGVCWGGGGGHGTGTVNERMNVLFCFPEIQLCQLNGQHPPPTTAWGAQGSIAHKIELMFCFIYYYYFIRRSWRCPFYIYCDIHCVSPTHIGQWPFGIVFIVNRNLIVFYKMHFNKNILVRSLKWDIWFR